MKLIYTIGILFVAAISVFGDEIQERAKAKIVSRMYQATFGAEEYCGKASPEYKKSFDDALKHFITQNAQLVNMIQSSPYYEKAIATMESNKNKPTGVIDNDCKGLAWMLNSLTDTHGGQKAIEEYEKILQK